MAISDPINLNPRIPLVLSALAIGLLVNMLPIALPFLQLIPFSFLGWAIPLSGSSAYLILRLKRINFPITIWCFWILWVVMYLLFAEANNAFQRSLMLLTPLAVGSAFSTLRINSKMLVLLNRWLIIYIGIYFAIFVIVRGSGAAGVITASLLSAWFSAGYAMQGRMFHLFLWVMLALIPVVSTTRMGIIAVAATLPATLAPLSMKLRILFVSILLIAGLGVFQSDKVQEKMFFSGEGTIQQAFESGIAMLTNRDDIVSSDFRTNARKNMYAMIKSDVDNAYWFGHGANAVEEITSQYFDGLTHPHNDWLRLQYDYGTLGVLIFAITMLLQMVSAWRVAKKLDGEAARFMYAGASAFIPMAMFMLTDNVIMYVAWFGNLHFAMLGIGYASLRAKKVGLL